MKRENIKEFRLLKTSQNLAATVFQYTAKAEKDYKTTICRIIQEYSCQVVHYIRFTNALNVNDALRKEMHEKTLECIDRINDLLPVLSRCRCITLKQEAELHKNFFELRKGYEGWMKSDQKRI